MNYYSEKTNNYYSFSFSQTCNNLELLYITYLGTMPKCLTTDTSVGESATNCEMQVVCPRSWRQPVP